MAVDVSGEALHWDIVINDHGFHARVDARVHARRAAAGSYGPQARWDAGAAGSSIAVGLARVDVRGAAAGAREPQARWGAGAAACSIAVALLQARAGFPQVCAVVRWMPAADAAPLQGAASRCVALRCGAPSIARARCRAAPHFDGPRSWFRVVLRPRPLRR